MVVKNQEPGGRLKRYQIKGGSSHRLGFGVWPRQEMGGAPVPSAGFREVVNNPHPPKRTPPRFKIVAMEIHPHCWLVTAFLCAEKRTGEVPGTTGLLSGKLSHFEAHGMAGIKLKIWEIRQFHFHFILFHFLFHRRNYGHTRGFPRLPLIKWMYSGFGYGSK